MELRQLEYFVAVAEELHFTRAAAGLHIAQSGLSAAVRALERELGAELFTRTTRRVELTAAGRVLLVEARRTLAAAQAAREAVAAVGGLLSGTLAVGAEQCMGAPDPAELLAGVQERHPGIEVTLEHAGSRRLLERVRGGRLDLALVAGADPATEGVELEPLGVQPLVLLCPAGHPLAAAGRTAMPVAGLAGEVFVDMHPDWGARRLTDAAFAGAGVRRRVAMQVNDVHALLDLVVRGAGVAMVPKPLTRKDITKGLHVMDLPDAPKWEVAVARRAGAAVSPAAGVVLAALR
jgi:DNA-binding transcriptional LysR family regulator